jgi:hypothetical protein
VRRKQPAAIEAMLEILERRERENKT